MFGKPKPDDANPEDKDNEASESSSQDRNKDLSESLKQDDVDHSGDTTNQVSRADGDEAVSEEETEIPAVDGTDSQEPAPEELARKYLDNWRRTQADFDNYKKRMAKEKEILAQSIREDLLYGLLPTVDHLELALKSAGEDTTSSSLSEGVKLILDGLYKYLESYDVKKMESIGKPFDYNFQEAVKYEETTDQPDNHVIAELIPGYMMEDRVLRAAKVILARHPDEGKTDVNDSDNGDQAGVEQNNNS